MEEKLRGAGNMQTISPTPLIWLHVYIIVRIESADTKDVAGLVGIK